MKLKKLLNECKENKNKQLDETKRKMQDIEGESIKI
jgi:hypothetical protein